MKPDLHRIQSFILIAFFCAMCTVCNGQVEELMPSDSSQVTEINTPEPEEVKLILVSEKDSTSSKVAPAKVKSHTEPSRPEKVKEESEEDDSILSFNFIYYIIRKFKLSDIIDH